jgi:hypothetical protein
VANRTGLFLGLFDPEDGGDMFLRKFGRLSTDYTRVISQIITAVRSSHYFEEEHWLMKDENAVLRAEVRR